MGMTLRVAYLWIWLVGLTLTGCYFALGNTGLAHFAARELGPQSIDLLGQQGVVPLYLYSVGANVVRGVPYLVIGLAVGLMCRGLGWARAYRRRRDANAVHTRRDRWGGSLEMHRAPLEYDPNVGFCALPAPTVLPAGMSPVERDAFALLHLHPDWPADLENYHGTSLALHTRNAWQLAVQRYGMGSLTAMVAVCHDLGKLRAYRKSESGTFTRVGHHPAETLTVVRSLPGLLELPLPQRDEFLQLLTAAVTGAVPLNFPEDKRAILRAYQSSDFRATRDERNAAEEETVVDPDAIARLVEGDRMALLRSLNINQSIDASTAALGWYVPSSDRLWLFLEAVHRQLLALLPVEIVQGLPSRLRKRNKLQANELAFLAQVIAQWFDVDEVVDGKTGAGGVFELRSKRVSCWAVAVRAESIPADVKNTWGGYAHEIDIL